MAPADVDGLIVEVCPKCSGVWLDDVELTELLNSRPEFFAKLENVAVPRFEVVKPARAEKTCPHGHTTLETFRYFFDSPIELDSCPMCYGVFVENEELSDIAEYARDKFRGEREASGEDLKRLEGHVLTSLGNQNPQESNGLLHALTHWHNRKRAHSRRGP
jgi:Zn-finger nucleic acid-binding protein